MSTSAQAVAAATRLQTIMRSYGVECRFQLRQGASGSGWMTPLSQRVGVMSHHVASRPSQGNTPFYNLVRNGRGAAPGAPAVPGPLANGYGGFDRIYRIITLGWANHPGAGGPLSLPGGTVPRDNGRPRFWGTEYEGGFEDWTPAMHDFMSRANAAILDWLNLPTNAHVEHSTWAPNRKIDRRGYTAASGRTRITAVRGSTGGGSTTPTPTPPKDWFDMATQEDLEAALWNVFNRPISVAGGERLPLYTLIRNGHYALDAARGVARQVAGYDVKISGRTRAALGVDSRTIAQLNRDGAAATYEGREQHAKVMTALAALEANQNGITAADVAKELAPLLLDDLQATVTEAVEASEGRDADEIGLAVVTEMSHRLNQGA